MTYAAFVAASTILLSIAVSYREANIALSDLRQQQRLLSMVAALQVDAGYHEKLWPFEILSSLASEKGFVSWKIIDGSGKIILSEPPAAPEQVAVTALPSGQPRLIVDEDAKTETWLVPMRMRTATIPWRFSLTYDTSIVGKYVRSILAVNLMFALGITLLLAPLSWVLTRGLLGPLFLLTRAATNLGRGDSQEDLVLPQERNDELGKLVQAFKGMHQGILERDQKIQSQLNTIEQARDKLETRVEERTDELNQSTQALKTANKRLAKLTRAAEAANQAKSDFLANMSHELRTPMTAILGYVDILADLNSTPHSREATETIKRNGLHLLEIINDILDLSKIESGKYEFENIRCSPGIILADVKSLMQVRADEKKLELRIENEGPIPEFIHSDPTRLRQILINLTGNAIKFTQSGEVQLVTSLVNQKEKQPLLQIKVIDTGIGITSTQMKQLFQSFHQADASTSRKYGGTGLGLILSKRLAQMLGGNIDVRSSQNKGSTFTLTIATGLLDDIRLLDNPFDIAPEEDLDGPKTKQQMNLYGIHLLLAEDGIDNQRLISFILQKAGAQVSLAENGQIAYELAMSAHQSDSPFDAVLMDMQMPVLDGYEATRRLRGDGYTRPIIALTANAMSHDRQKCLNAGCTDYLSKPIDRQQLVAKITQWAGNKHRKQRSMMS